MDREPSSAKGFVRCPECLRILPNHTPQCSVYQDARRKLLKLGFVAGATTVTAFLLGRTLPVSAISAPSIGGNVEPGSLRVAPDYIIYQDSGKYLAKNGSTGKNDFQETDLTILINTDINPPTTGYWIHIAPGTYNAGGQIKLVNKLKITGSGMDRTIIQSTTGTDYLFIPSGGSDATHLTDIELSDMTLQRAGSVSSATFQLVWIVQADHSVFQRLKIISLNKEAMVFASGGVGDTKLANQHILVQQCDLSLTSPNNNTQIVNVEGLDITFVACHFHDGDLAAGAGITFSNETATSLPTQACVAIKCFFEKVFNGLRISNAIECGAIGCYATGVSGSSFDAVPKGALYAKRCFWNSCISINPVNHGFTHGDQHLTTNCLAYGKIGATGTNSNGFGIGGISGSIINDVRISNSIAAYHGSNGFSVGDFANKVSLSNCIARANEQGGTGGGTFGGMQCNGAANQDEIEFRDCTAYDDQGVVTQTNSFQFLGTGTNIRAYGGRSVNGTIVTTRVDIIKDVIGFNPVGSETPAVPLSGTAVAAVPYDRTYYVTTVVGGCTMAIQNGPSVVIPASDLGAVKVPAGKTVTPTYTNAPTWVVEGE